jgi:hypothetical protein
MMRQSLLLAAAVLTVAAAPAKPPAKAPAKPAPKPAAAPAKPAPARATPAAPFDARDPQSLIGLLTEAGARAQTGRRDGDSVFVTVGSTAANFSVQFAGCDRAGKGCQAALFDALLEAGTPTLAQVNGFNQTSVTCRVYIDRGNKAHVLYSQVLMASDTRDSARTHLAAWQGCLVDSRDFVRDPVAYLANAA